MAQNTQYTDLGVNQGVSAGANLQNVVGQGAYIQGDQAGLGQGLIGGQQGGIGQVLGHHHHGGLEQGLLGQQAGLGQGLIGGNQVGLGQGLIGQGFDQGLLGQGGLNQGLIGGQNYIGQQGFPIQGQQYGLDQGLLGQGVLGQGLIGQNLIGQGLPGQIVGHTQGVPGQGLSSEDYARQSLLAGAGAHFHTNPGLAGTGAGLGGYGQTQPQLITNAGLTQPGLGHSHGLGTAAGLGTATALGTGAVLGGHHLHNNLGTTTGATGAGVAGAGVAGAGGVIGRGTFTFRPIEGKFLKDKDIIGKMDPYCKIKIGRHSGKSSVAKKEGTNPIWDDVITIEKKHNEQFAKLKVKDKDRFTLNDRIGEAKIPLADVLVGNYRQWIPISKKSEVTGEILMEITFLPRETV